MFEYKLQIGCFLVVLYFLLIYVREATGNHKMKCHRLFDVIISLSPWAIFFDGATAWTVNHMDVVPSSANLILHGMFFVCEDILIILLSVYMFRQIGPRSYGKKKWLLLLPGILSVILILAFLGQLYYVEGRGTYYSMGISVVVCYLSLIIHFLFVAILVIKNHRMIEKRKKISIFSFVVISFAILAVQVAIPEVLISALLPTVAIVCIYENFENPYLRRLHRYNEEMVTGFATLVENRDNNTGGHIHRTREYVRIILEEMKKKPEYNKILTRDYVRNVLDASPMHDIGKISTPDSILQKPGKLTDEEYAIMKEHSAVGGEIIKKTFADLDNPEYLKIAYEVARYHHEKWNGKGYPDGLSGKDIPLHARIMAIADVFDAVSAKRVYRDAMPLDKCFRIIEEGVGRDFDPELATMFLSAEDKIREYYKENNEA